MSGTMSSASGDWLQFYQHSDPAPSKAEVGWTGKPATAANITSTTSPPQTGRVSKPNPRRRSRASKRTPTTLLSTDTTNFRAMVQQFTGGGQTGQAGPPPFISTNESTNQFLGTTYSNNNSANLNFGLGLTSSMVAPLPPLPPPPAGAYSVQFRQPQDGRGGGVDQHQQYYVSSSGNNSSAQHQAFLQTLQNYASAGPTRESSRDVGPTTQGEDNNYMF